MARHITLPPFGRTGVIGLFLQETCGGVAELIAPMRQGSVLYHGCEVDVLWENIQRVSPTEVSRQNVLANRHVALAAARFLSETDFSKVVLPLVPPFLLSGSPLSLVGASVSLSVCLRLSCTLLPSGFIWCVVWLARIHQRVCLSLPILVPRWGFNCLLEQIVRVSCTQLNASAHVQYFQDTPTCVFPSGLVCLICSAGWVSPGGVGIGKQQHLVHVPGRLPSYPSR
jgi:hypothetical protein